MLDREDMSGHLERGGEHPSTQWETHSFCALSNFFLESLHRHTRLACVVVVYSPRYITRAIEKSQPTSLFEAPLCSLSSLRVQAISS